MKLLLALLLLLNLALFLLFGPYERAALLPGTPAAGAGSGLTLLAEADPVQLRPAPSARPPATAAERVEPASGPVATAPEAERPGQPSTPAPTVAPTRPSGRVAICYTLGTLPDRLRVERVLGELGKLGLSAAVRSEERRGDLSGYWVLLPAQASLDEAQGVMAELQQRGIDSFVVGTGEYRNAVSLGFFHGRRAAEELEARIRGQGYNPRLVLRYRQETQFWLDLDEAASERFSDAHWEALVAAHPTLGRYVRDCG